MTALLDGGAVLRNSLSIVETRVGKELIQVRVHGRIECRGGVLVVVDKYLNVRRGRQRRYEVRGAKYSYQALIRDSEQTILRYDSAHGGIAGLHRHKLNQSGGSLIRRDIPLENLPTLDGFILEAIELAERLGS